MTNQATIYGLKDPDTGEIRYIGATTDPERRFRQHLMRNDGTGKSKWLASLQADSVKQPKLVILETLTNPTRHEVAKAERKWVQHGHDRGWNLTNMRPGAYRNRPTSRTCLTTYVGSELAQRIDDEARRMRVSTSAVVRWALMERYGVGQSEASGTEEA